MVLQVSTPLVHHGVRRVPHLRALAADLQILHERNQAHEASSVEWRVQAAISAKRRDECAHASLLALFAQAEDLDEASLMQRTNAVEVMPPRLGVGMKARVDGSSEIDVALELLLE